MFAAHAPSLILVDDVFSISMLDEKPTIKVPVRITIQSFSYPPLFLDRLPVLTDLQQQKILAPKTLSLNDCNLIFEEFKWKTSIKFHPFKILAIEVAEK